MYLIFHMFVIAEDMDQEGKGPGKMEAGKTYINPGEEDQMVRHLHSSYRHIHVRDWSLITGRGGGGLQNERWWRI